MKRTIVPGFALVALACQPAPTSTVARGAQADTVVVALELAEDCGSLPSDGFLPGALRLDGELLVADVSFSGGCAPHTFRACWDGSILESFPQQVSVRLLHDANGDLCRAILAEEVRIDLGELTALGPLLVGVQSFGESVLLGEAQDADGRLTTAQLADAFPEAAAGALYMSEGDYAPEFVSGSVAGAANAEMSLELVQAALGERIVQAYSDSDQEVSLDELAFSFKGENPTKSFLNKLAKVSDDADEADFESAEAFGRVRDLLLANLTELRLVRVGPLGEDGEMNEDAGLYFWIVAGKTTDGQLAGFILGSVET